MLSASKAHVIPNPIAHSTRHEKRQHSDRNDGEATLLFASAFASISSETYHTFLVLQVLAARPIHSVQGKHGASTLKCGFGKQKRSQTFLRIKKPELLQVLHPNKIQDRTFVAAQAASPC